LGGRERHLGMHLPPALLLGVIRVPRDEIGVRETSLVFFEELHDCLLPRN
jgi:hypothetical protein